MKAKVGSSPAAYRKIKSVNLGLVQIWEMEAQPLESGRNECAIGPSSAQPNRQPHGSEHRGAASCRRPRTSFLPISLSYQIQITRNWTVSSFRSSADPRFFCWCLNSAIPCRPSFIGTFANKVTALNSLSTVRRDGSK
jgi:hypothetical protein